MIAFIKKNWFSVLMFLLALATFIFNDFYNEVIKSKILTYTLLPSYSLGNEYFSGIVIENRGRASLTNIEINISDLDSTNKTINIPNPHERVKVISGGQGFDEVILSMPRLSTGSSLSIYLITENSIVLEENQTFIVTSTETSGVSGTSQNPVPLSDILVYVITALSVGAIIYFVFIVSDNKWVKNTLADATIGSDTELYQFIFYLPDYQRKWLEELVDKKFTPQIFYHMHLGELSINNREGLLFVLLSWHQHGVLNINASDEEMTMELNPEVNEILRRIDLFRHMEVAIHQGYSKSRLKKVNEKKEEQTI